MASSNGGGASGGRDDRPGHQNKLDSFVPIFDNQQRNYREFRKRCELYKRKMEMGSRQKETVFNIVTMLTGKSWDLVEDFSMEQLAAENAFEAVFARLDSGFRYDPLTELPEDFEMFFIKLQRRGGQTLQDYITDFMKAERRLKNSHGVELPEKVKAWWFLRRSGITREQRQMILTNVGVTGLAMDTVMKAMSFILGQDSRTDTSQRYKGHKEVYYHEEEHDWDFEQADNQLPVYYEYDEEAVDELWMDDGQDYYAEDPINFTAEPVYDVDEYDEVYATYQDAKSKLNALRTSRGFYPVVVSLDASSGAKGSETRPKSMTSGKKGKDKGKKRAPGKGKGVNPKGRAASAGFGGTSKTLCLRCGQPGHWARNCPQAGSPDKKRKVDMGEDINMVQESYDLDNDDGDFESDDRAVQDGGAASVLGSYKQIRRYLCFLVEKGFNIHDLKAYSCVKTFSYGNSQKETTQRCLFLPMFFGGKRIDVLTYIIKGEAPLLMGRPVLEELGLTVDYGSKSMRWPDKDWEPLEVGARGEHLLRLGKDIRECRDHEPSMILTPHDFNEHINGELTMAELLNERDEVCAVEEVGDLPAPIPAELTAETITPKGGTDEQESARDQVPTKRLHAHKLRKMIKQAEDEVRETEKIFMMSKTLSHGDEPRRKIWEVFAGLGRTSACLDEYPHVDLRTFSLEGGWDFDEPSNRRLFLRLLRDEKPDEILMAPMCRLWSPLQELNAAQSDSYKQQLIWDRKMNHDTILTMCAMAYLEQQRNGRQATIEHPWNSRAWSTRAFKSLEANSFDCYVDQCMYGLVLPTDLGDDEAVRKPTCFRTTKESLALGLMQECDGQHYHIPLEGSYRGVSRSKMAEDYPLELAQRLAELMQMPETSKADAIHAAEEQEHAADDAAQEENPGDFVYKNLQLQKEVGISVMQYIRRLHKNLGHPSPQVLTKMLEEIQATEDVLKAARGYECALCHERKGPSGVPPAAGLTARVFGERLLADTAWVDTDDGRCCMMTMMDQATRYVAIRIMKDEQSVTLVKGLERGWIKHFGVPKYLRIDEGKGFAATHLRDWCSEHGIMLEIAPAESHNWLGSIERKHQVVRKAVELYMLDKGKKTKKTLLEAAIYCPGQINSLSYTRGFTPAQWVLGQAPRDTLSLTSSIFNPGMTTGNEPDDFNEIQQKRLSAQMAFLKADSDARLRRAMHQNYKQNKYQVVVGQRCYYWRLQGTGKLQKNKWRGPARCVAEECDENGKSLVLWLCHGTSLLRCSPHQVRPVVEDIGAELPVDAAAALEDLKALRARSTTQFKDVAELRSPDAVVEDLLDDDEYMPETDGEQGSPELSQMAGALAFQTGREIVTDEIVPETPLDSPIVLDDDLEADAPGGIEPEAEADIQRKRASMGHPDSPKRARTETAVPVPELTTDELLVEGAYIAEIHDDSLPSDWVLIEGQFELDEVWAAQLRGGEANEKTMSVAEREQMVAAKVKELTSFFDNQVWDFVEVGKVRPERVVTARWVLTWKTDQDTGLQKAKARLVLKGFQDPDILTMEKTAPTASKTSKMLLLALTPNLGWSIMCGDVRAAFLSGSTFKRRSSSSSRRIADLCLGFRWRRHT